MASSRTPRRPAEALAVEVADGQQVLLVQARGEEQADQDQAGAGAEGVFDDRVEAALHELGGNAHHRLGAEPGREGGGDHHDQRQAAAGDREVGGVLDARAGPDADAERAEQIQDRRRRDQGGVHACGLCVRSIENLEGQPGRWPSVTIRRGALSPGLWPARGPSQLAGDPVSAHDRPLRAARAGFMPARHGIR